MAHGVPETEVFEAADRVLQRGERPTVERVRGELGRGSPGRVGQLLEVWWDRLAKRHAAETRLPDLPAEVSATFKEAWRVASESASAQAHSALETERAAIIEERQKLAGERDEWQAAVALAQAAVTEEREAHSRAEARLVDLQRLLDQHERQHAAQAERIDALQAQVAAADVERRALQADMSSRESMAAQERDAAAAHIRTVEDRAHVEIDRARQEAKSLAAQVERMEREFAAATQATQLREDKSRAALSAAECVAAEHAARAQALGQQLARLDGLSDALVAAQRSLQDGLVREAQLRDDVDGLRKELVVAAGRAELPESSSRRLRRPGKATT